MPWKTARRESSRLCCRTYSSSAEYGTTSFSAASPVSTWSTRRDAACDTACDTARDTTCDDVCDTPCDDCDDCDVSSTFIMLSVKPCSHCSSATYCRWPSRTCSVGASSSTRVVGSSSSDGAMHRPTRASTLKSRSKLAPSAPGTLSSA